MAKQSLFLGTVANDGTGSNLRAGGTIVNANFDEIYGAIGDGSIIDNDRLRNLVGGAGIGTNLVGNDLTISVDSTVVTASSVTTLENKTIDIASNTIQNAHLLPPISIADNSSTIAQINLGETLVITGGTGVNTTVTGDTLSITASGITNTEIDASAGILNSQLASDSVTLGYTAVALGSTASSINGLSITGFAQFNCNASASAIRFNHANLASFPAYAAYSGTPALDETTLKPYIATASGWVELITENSGIQGLSNVNTTGINNGEVIKWNASTTRFEPSAPISTDKSNTGDGSTTTFTIVSGRTVDNILVFVDGLCLVPTDDYTVATTVLTFISAPANSAEIVIRYIG
jgi:hypothetical protein